ncbi:fructose-2,6-bisphosphatase TIGAR B-like [Tigriopus californicus]|uniref:fructose-2,6-bisphosphatase TIGAR B-like n=1 Tax=Tigriopus californicus TaxID=6832 RepID=UPI0027DA749C|nr:fructose-2,6-bisphosphatase TIGAR B-like [Tigriopus californicus]|eukprot:TCALIF_13966-PA protein Name:"Similar to tigarb Fructose-2,6-bisphosphatase TIGAR B (Danio rerio)" AED:0.22 eAED:0.22 QI:248/0.5/0.33/0.66/0.5/0.66/3/0/227
MTIELYIVRHGQTEGNRARILQGSSDIPLNEVGREQAQKASQVLKDVPFTAVFSSDLCRALETAQILLKGHTTCQIPIIQWPCVRERCFGVMEGKPIQEYYEASALANEKHFNYVPENGESHKEVEVRAHRFMEQLCETDVMSESSGGHGTTQPVILVTTHGGFLKGLMTVLVEKMGCDLSESSNQAYSSICQNTGITRVTFSLDANKKPVNMKCTKLYDAAHLNDG